MIRLSIPFSGWNSGTETEHARRPDAAARAVISDGENLTERKPSQGRDGGERAVGI